MFTLAPAPAPASRVPPVLGPRRLPPAPPSHPAARFTKHNSVLWPRKRLACHDHCRTGPRARRPTGRAPARRRAVRRGRGSRQVLGQPPAGRGAEDRARALVRMVDDQRDLGRGELAARRRRRREANACHRGQYALSSRLHFQAVHVDFGHATG